MADPTTDDVSMPADATRNMFMVTAGFGIGALVVLFGFVLLVGIGVLGHEGVSGPGSTAQSTAASTPAGQSAATAPAKPGPSPNPVKNTAAPAVPSSTTGQGPAPANPETQRAPTQGQQSQQQQKPK